MSCTHGARFIEMQWDDGAAVYDTASGSTHLLDSFTHAVFDTAVDVGCDCAAICSELADSIDITEHTHKRIELALEQLINAQLL